MNVFSTGRGLAAVVAVALLLTACDVAPIPTATPLPTPTASPLRTATPAPAALPQPWPCREFGGYCGLFAVGGNLLAAAWLDDRRMYLSDQEGRIRLLDVSTGDINTMIDGLSWPRGLTALDGRLYVSELGNTCELLRELSGNAEQNSCRYRS